MEKTEHNLHGKDGEVPSLSRGGVKRGILARKETERKRDAGLRKTIDGLKSETNLSRARP